MKFMDVNSYFSGLQAIATSKVSCLFIMVLINDYLMIMIIMREKERKKERKKVQRDEGNLCINARCNFSVIHTSMPLIYK